MREENEVTLKKNQVTWKKKIVGKSAKVRWEKRIRWRWKKKNCHQGESIFVKLSSSIFDSTFPSYFSSRFGRIKILDLGEKTAIQVFYPSHFPSLPKLWKIAFSTLFSFLYFPSSLFSPNQTQPKDNSNLYWVITHKTLNWSISIFF